MKYSKRCIERCSPSSKNMTAHFSHNIEAQQELFGCHIGTTSGQCPADLSRDTSHLSMVRSCVLIQGRPRDVDAKFPGIKLEGLRTSFDYDFRMPDILNVKDVMIRMPPDDRLEVRSNPLYSFKFTEKLNLDRDWATAKLGVSPSITPWRSCCLTTCIGRTTALTALYAVHEIESRSTTTYKSCLTFSTVAVKVDALQCSTS